MKSVKEKCGCVYEAGERERWLQLCPAHAEEFNNTRERWAQEHKEKQKEERPK